MHPTVSAMWHAFLAAGTASPDLHSAPISAWHFCDNQRDADECAALVIQGRKRATAPSAWGLTSRGEPLPRAGDHHVVTDWSGIAQCVIRTTAVRVLPFSEVDEAHAAAEGEGDGSLDWWRSVHWEYYRRELEGTGLEPREDMPVVCEYFTVVFPPSAGKPDEPG